MPVSLCATQAYLFNIIRISYFSSTITNALFASYKPIPPPESLSNDFTSFIAFRILSLHFLFQLFQTFSVLSVQSKSGNPQYLCCFSNGKLVYIPQKDKLLLLSVQTFYYFNSI